MNEKHVIKRFVKAKKLFSKYALPVILCTFSLASAQNSDVKIIGTVLEYSVGQQFFGVTVSLKGNSNVASTDATGSFSI